MEPLQMDNTYLIDTENVPFQQEYNNDSPCVGCELLDSCAKTAQGCEAYRKYTINGKFKVSSVGVKFKGLK